MGVRLSIEGSESIKLQETSITGIEFGADIPHDSNARSTDLGSTVLITGKILAAVDGETADDTSKLAKWSLVPAEKSDCYRKVQINVVSASQIVRQIIQPKLVGDSMGMNPLFTLVLLYVGYKAGSVLGMILAVPIGMIIVNLYKAGAFDYILDDVKILAEGVLSLRVKK